MFRNFSKLLTVALFAQLFSLNADCWDEDCDDCSYEEDLRYSHFYLGGGGTFVNACLHQPIFIDEPAIVISGQNQNFKKNVSGMGYGGFEFSCNSCWNFGCEIGYKDLGNYHTSFEWVDPLSGIFGHVHRQLHSQAGDVLLISRYTHTSGINFFLKGGVSWVFSKIDEEGLPSYFEPFGTLSPYPQNRACRIYNFDPELVMGVGFYLTKYLNITASWSHIFGSSQSPPDCDDHRDHGNPGEHICKPDCHHNGPFDPGFEPQPIPYSPRGLKSHERHHIHAAPSFDVVMIGIELSFGFLCI